MLWTMAFICPRMFAALMLVAARHHLRSEARDKRQIDGLAVTTKVTVCKLQVRVPMVWDARMISPYCKRRVGGGSLGSSGNEGPLLSFGQQQRNKRPRVIRHHPNIPRLCFSPVP